MSHSMAIKVLAKRCFLRSTTSSLIVHALVHLQLLVDVDLQALQVQACLFTSHKHHWRASYCKSNTSYLNTTSDL